MHFFNLKKLTAMVCTAALTVSMLPQIHAESGKVYSLPLFETSDVHGFLANTATDSPKDYAFRMAYIANVVNKARVNGDPATSLLLDGGDIYQGHVVSNLQDGRPMVEAYATMQYDAVALGNHEFDWGVESLCDPDGTMTGYYEEDGGYVDSQVPIICCNIYSAATGKRVDFTKDYVILDKVAVADDGSQKAVKVAVLGYAEDYSSSIMASRIEPYSIRTFDIEQVKIWAHDLKASGEADAVVVVSHSGGSSVAGLLSGSDVDLVCGGHTHTSQSGTSGNVAYIQPVNQAQAYGSAMLNFSDDGVSVSDQTVTAVVDTDATVTAGKLDLEILDVSRRAIDGVADELNEVIGYITESVINTRDSAGNFLCNLMNAATGSKLAFINSGGVRTSFDVVGDRRNVTVGDMYTMLPFCNMLYVYEVTYGDMLYSLEGNSFYTSGVEVYTSGNKVNALIVDDKCIYKDGVWAGGWRNAKVKISVNEYIATGRNPFTTWNVQGKVIDTTSYVDNVSAIEALKKQVEGTDGHIILDTQNHTISGTYSGELTKEKPDCDHAYEPTTYSPSCTRDGYIQMICKFCNDSYRGETLPALGHHYVEDAQKSTASTAFYVCANCQDSYSQRRPDYCASKPFVDINTNLWYHEAIDYVLEQGLMNGMSNDHFAPNTTITRAMLVSILYRLDGSPEVEGSSRFADVKPNAYYAPAVLWGEQFDVVSGTSKTTFSPNAPVTREQIAAFLFRYEGLAMKHPNVSGSLKPFADANQVAPYAKEALEWAVGVGIISGMSETTLAPRANATRAQFASMIWRYLTIF